MQSDNNQLLPPLLPSAWSEEVFDALGAFPGGLKFVWDGWHNQGVAVRGTNMLGAFAHHPALAKAFLTFNNHVASNSTLETREREILILRTGWLRKCEYEFVMHIILGLRAGLTEEEVARIQDGPDAPGWTAEDADLVRAADELHRDARISKTTMNRLATRYNQQQLMDLVFLVGCYDVVAMVVNSFDIPVEASEPPLDPDIKAKMMGS